MIQQKLSSLGFCDDPDKKGGKNMKKSLIFGLVFIFSVLAFVACGPKTPKAGTATADSMIAMFPADVIGIFNIDMKAAMETEMAQKMIKEDKEYLEFVEKTGINPKEDIYYLTVGIMGEMNKEDAEAAALINLKYDKESLLAKMKEEQEEPMTEEEYEGYTIYIGQEEDQDWNLVLLDESNILIGEKESVTAVLDVLLNKRENVNKNEELKSLLDKTNKKAMFWGSMVLPPEMMQEAAQESPMFGNLADISALSLYFDFKNNNILAEIMVFSPDEAKNKQVADFLTGIKGLGGMMAAEKPEIGELLNKITISSSADHVKIKADIPEDLIKSLIEEAKPDLLEEEDDEY
jgi:hypothetical protein